VNRFRGGTLALVAAATAASFWLQLQARRDAANPPGWASRPESYIEQPRWEQFDEQGRRVRQLQARRAEQWSGEPHARLIEPRLTLRDGQQRDWQFQAALGHLSAEGGALSLQQQVVLRPLLASQGPVLTTERLDVGRQGDLVETDAPVVLQSRNWHFSAGGLRAALGGDRIELFNRVRGTHE